MKMPKLLLPIVIGFTASYVLGQDYEIRLARPSRVGQKLEVAAIGSQTQHVIISRDGQTLKEDTSSINTVFEGIATVLAIDRIKLPTKIRITVSEFRILRDGDTDYREALAEGAQIIVQLRNGKKEYLIDGQSAPKNLEDALKLLFSVHSSENTDDDTFGTTERKKIGDTWPANTAKAAASLSSGMGVADSIDAANITGSATLEKIVDVDGIKCLRISGKADLHRFKPPLPIELALEKSTISAKFSGDYPVDISLDARHYERSFSATMQGKGRPTPDGPEVTMTINGEQSYSEDTKPLGK